MDPVTAALTIAAALIELVRQSQASGAPLTQAQVDAVVASWNATVAESKSLDPKD